MQYAFAYFFYVMNRNKLVELNVVDYLRTEIDTNQDGIIDKNEQRTLAALMTKEVITQQDLDALEVGDETTMRSLCRCCPAGSLTPPIRSFAVLHRASAPAGRGP